MGGNEDIEESSDIFIDEEKDGMKKMMKIILMKRMTWACITPWNYSTKRSNM